MLRLVCKSKIHRATVTEVDLDYEGSITIDDNLLREANILPNEIVLVANLSNGERFETYVMKGKAGSGIVALNGAAARLGMPGDKVIIISSVLMDDDEASIYKPIVVRVDEKNKILKDERR
ncbi:MAG: aspartate 1-decarboxylase [Candidatus Edwardsbacteria bacterium]